MAPAHRARHAAAGADDALGVLAQRLVRKLCPHCKRPDGAGRWHPVGCAECGQTGYKGRIALYEVMPLYDEIKELVLVGASTAELKREAMRLGVITLRQAGINKLKQGITTVEEVVRCSVKD